ncbi:MAG: large conductance mechanosensitive channel protein MscL [Schaalia hyovaginalis]|nr:large conductance mechanosensitive channel protein MscL [Schaalia hyovaginalis]MCF2710929.1 large conductance mechanosensitive channel protein MscL [Schaalia hyovaginalis]MCI7512097.1 large conductance mechanosensitive channel protein MscL [Schaalia hyovaginalis]MDY3665107.1 large conductance mechanosensitive channel protein MscL [Schaalia hyovaginalis]MDY4263196.1 large conductance mechanosensitive channel protein MscL [Schaalia hyovaginalis]MDY4491376.1 large conductance mechanosensitive 
MIKGFKDFISNGNVLDLAVAVIIGAAFKPIVDAITNVIMGVIGALVGQPNFDSVLQFTINGSDPIQPGTIITALVNFLLIAAAVYFAIVLPMNKLKERKAAEEAEEEEEPSEDVKLLTEIRDLLASKNA